LRGRPENLLERKLIFRMAQVQVLALLLFFGLCVFPLVIYPIFKEIGDTQSLDTTVADHFASSLRPGPDNTIVTETSAGLEQLAQDFPRIWFYGQARSGASTTFGEGPAIYREIAEQVWAYEGLDARMASDSEGGIGLRTVMSSVGEVRVLTGNGPAVSATSIIGWLLSALAVGITLVVVIVSAVVIPLVIRREMRGIKAAAAQAQAINSRSKGTLLSLDDVPDEVAPLVRSINEALERLDASAIERERFLADSAHELRTPIAILQTRIEAEDPFPAQTRLLLDVTRLSTLADQLLDLQRMDLTENRFVPVDLNEVASEVVGDLAPLADASGYQLSLTSAGRPIIVQGDFGSLVRALTNIVQNAITYGGGTGKILVQVDADGRISVSDEGPGIPERERGRILEPFYRATRSTRGSGLGLNLVDLIVRRHHGRLAVHASGSGGALFIITLPLGPEQSARL
jgi:signal transduction histidine kinase